MYFTWALRNDFAEFNLVYQETVSSNALSDRSIPFLQMKKKIRASSSVAQVSVTCRTIKRYRLK